MLLVTIGAGAGAPAAAVAVTSGGTHGHHVTVEALSVHPAA